MSDIAFRFPQGRIVKHLKTGSLYKIYMTPDKVSLEHSNKPAYVYSPAVQKVGEVLYWVRDQEEMEDGRFELIPFPVRKQRDATWVYPLKKPQEL